MQDLTPLIKATLDIPDACVYNPSFVFLDPSTWSSPDGSSPLNDMAAAGNLLLVSVRIYWSRDKGTPCVEPREPGGQWAEWWKGTQGHALLVIHRIPHPSQLHLDTIPPGSIIGQPEEDLTGGGGGGGPTTTTRVLSHILYTDESLEDARLFRDDQGKIR